MSPPISKDWWLAAALTSAALPSALAQPAPGPGARQSGVVTTVTKGGASTSAPLYIESASGQRVVTGPNETKHVLFADQSALTVGPNSDVVIANFRYDPQTKDGNLLIEMSRGLLRVVGGFISKRSEATVRTATATIGIRGGISIVDSNGQQTSGTFLFGQQMRMSNVPNGGGGSGDVTITRPGFGSSNSSQNPVPTPPQRTPLDQINGQLSQFNQTPPPPAPPPMPRREDAPGDLNNLANDRLRTQNDPNQGNLPGSGGGQRTPTLDDLLHSTQPSNQS